MPRKVVAYKSLKTMKNQLTFRPKKWLRSLTAGGRLLEAPTIRLLLGKFWCLGQAVSYGRWSRLFSSSPTPTHLRQRSINPPRFIFFIACVQTPLRPQQQSEIGFIFRVFTEVGVCAQAIFLITRARRTLKRKWRVCEQTKNNYVFTLLLLPCEQGFLSCMAFSVYEVNGVACVSYSWFVYPRSCPVRNLCSKPLGISVEHAPD